MTSSVSNGNSGPRALKGGRIGRILGDFRLIGVAVAVLYWFFESAVHAFLFREGTFVQQLIAPEPNEVWMRLLVIFLIIALGFCIQWALRILKTQKSNILREQRVSCFALVIGAIAVIAGSVIIALAYRTSVETAREHCEMFYLHEAQTIAAWINSQDHHSDSEIIKAVGYSWHNSGERPDDEYLYIVDKDSRLLLHTLNPDTVGNNCGKNAILDDRDVNICKLADLVMAKTTYVGRYVSSAGRKQIAAFAYISGRNWVVGIHRSEEVLRSEVRNNLKAMLAGMIVSCGVLMPLALVLLYLAFSKSLQYRKQIAIQLQKSHDELEKRVEERTATLDKINQQLQTSIDQMPAAYILWDIDFRILEWNRAAEEIFGYTRQEAVGCKIYDLIVPEDVRHLVGAVLEKLQNGESINYSKEDNNIRKDGTAIACQWHNKPLVDDDGNVFAILSIAEDVTERKQAEEHEKLHEAELAHAARLSTMGQMASGLAHEINQPLCAITSFADASIRMFESRRFKHREVLGAMQSVSTQARRAGEIIKNMRAFVRKDPASSSLVDTREVIRDSVNLVRGQIKQKQAKVELEFPDESLTANANRVQIEQVIINLIQNSLDAMDQTDVGAREILISASKTDDEMILVSVADSGKGLADTTPSQIFDPFFTTKEEGMGIGLSINTSIVEEHKGKLWAEDNESGATFKFTIPINGKEES